MSHLEKLTPVQLRELVDNLGLQVPKDASLEQLREAVRVNLKFNQYNQTYTGVSPKPASPKRKTPRRARSASPKRKTPKRKSPKRKSARKTPRKIDEVAIIRRGPLATTALVVKASPKRRARSASPKRKSPKRKSARKTPKRKTTKKTSAKKVSTKVATPAVVAGTVATAGAVAGAVAVLPKAVNVEVVASPAPSLIKPNPIDAIADLSTKPVITTNPVQKKKIVASYRKSVQAYVDEIQSRREKDKSSMGPTYLDDVVVDLGFSINSAKRLLEEDKNLTKDQVDSVTRRWNAAKVIQENVYEINKARDALEAQGIEKLLDLAQNQSKKLTEADRKTIVGLSNEQMRQAIAKLGVTPDCTCRRLDLVSAYLYAKGLLNPLTDM